MSDSALYGDPPNTPHDKLIIQGVYGSSKPPHKVPLTDNVVSHATPMVIGISFAIAFIIIITGARLATRIFRRGQRFGPDDWVIIPAALLSITYLADILARVTYACAGKHINYCTYSELGLFLELGAIDQVIFYAAVTMVKISMCLFNRRLTGLSSRPWFILHNSFLALLVCWWFITFFINLFQCQPVTGFFNFATQAASPGYHCLDKQNISSSFSIINAVTDFMLLCVPVIVIFKVQMPLGRKLRLCGLFCIGAVCCAASAVRFGISYKQSHDLTWVFVPEVSWTIVDVFFSTIVASLPALNAIIEMSISRVTGSGKSSYPNRSDPLTGDSETQQASRNRSLREDPNFAFDKEDFPHDPAITGGAAHETPEAGNGMEYSAKKSAISMPIPLHSLAHRSPRSPSEMHIHDPKHPYNVMEEDDDDSQNLNDLPGTAVTTK